MFADGRAGLAARAPCGSNRNVVSLPNLRLCVGRASGIGLSSHPILWAQNPAAIFATLLAKNDA